MIILIFKENFLATIAPLYYVVGDPTPITLAILGIVELYRNAYVNVK